MSPLFTVKEWKATTVKAKSKGEAERKARKQFDDEEKYEYDEGLDIIEVEA